MLGAVGIIIGGAAGVIGLQLGQAPLAACLPGPRINCVVDGDTFWQAGVKYRLENIDAPDTPGEGRCTPRRIAELAGSRNPPWCDAALARRSRDTLIAFMASGRVEIVNRGRLDRYGRALVRVTVDGEDAGEYLIARGLGRPWQK